MKFILLLSLLFNTAAWSQTNEISETEKKMVKEAEVYAQYLKGPKASESLRLRIQSEFGDFVEEEKLTCTYELIGQNVVPELYTHSKKITKSDCERRARKALESQSSIYNKVLIKHGKNSKWKTLELKR